MNQADALPSVDVHTHVGTDYAFFLAGWWPYAGMTQDLVQRLDRYGIDQAVCFPFVVPSAMDPYQFAADRSLTLRDGRFPYDHENPALITEIHRLGFEQRLKPLAMFDPGRCISPQVRALEELAGDVAGLKTQTEVLRSPIRNLIGEARDILRVAEAHDLPVLFHTAVSPSDANSQVRDCLDVAEAWPNVRFNLAHSLRFDREGLKRAAELPNVWVDCSAHLIHCRLAQRDIPAVAPPDERVDADYADPAAVLQAVHAILGERYMWGSDTPFNSWCDDGIQLVCEYGEEVATLNALPDAVRHSMSRRAPHDWLYGTTGAAR